ncbi:alpha-galactosidase [Lachnospiraceae bacterium KM106-2]|nr:alpha-galactosidase [Lachnospiraceae bacterium KM106-2]
MVKQLNSYELGDMQAIYFLDEQTDQVELMLLPQGMEPLDWNEKNQNIDSLVQLKLIGDRYPGGYAGGNSMRQGDSVTELKFEKQVRTIEEREIRIVTRMQDERGYQVEHHLVWTKGNQALESYVCFFNQSQSEVSLEMLSSFSIGGITPLTKGDAHDTLFVHRMRSVWSMEGRLVTDSIEEMQLEPSWGGHAVRVERFGENGSMPVNHYFPYVVVEDAKNQVFWGAQLAHNASWQMELYRKDDGLSVSGGLADREFGHWIKQIQAGERFQTPKAILSVCHGGGVDEISQRLTSVLQPVLDQGVESEQKLPVLFNEYCTTWGCPSHENIIGILDKIRNKGFEYFVIDCGWYKEAGVPWDVSMGDYQVSKELFPDGLNETVSAIKDAGMKPGIWFEIENVGEASKAYQREEHLLKRDGVTLTTTMRRFWDMRDPWVIQYLSERVIGTLKKYGFEYIKIDDNDTIGLGCDGAESLGEGLRQEMEAAVSFIRKMKEEIPNLIVENCASGGHRLEPGMMSLCSMASFSDAHECEEIPIIAANLHRVILPRQSQIWAVIRKTDSLKRMAYSIANTFLGRMCLSGDVIELKEEQWEVIENGIAFYKRIAPIIKYGFTKRFGPEITSYRHPKGWQGILRSGRNKTGDAYALFHVFYGVREKVLEIELDKEYELQEVYSDSDVQVTIEGNKLRYFPTEEMKAVAVYLKSR